MAKDILKRLEALENEEIIEIEDISMYEREIFGEETAAHRRRSLMCLLSVIHQIKVFCLIL